MVAIDESELAIPPEVEDGAEQRFYDRWNSLSRSQKVLVEHAETLGTASGSTSLTSLAAAVGDCRDNIERRLAAALNVLIAK